MLPLFMAAVTAYSAVNYLGWTDPLFVISEALPVNTSLIIGAVGLFVPVGLGDPADPMNTPEHVKPEWYFLALYQLLKYIPKTMGAVLPIVGAIALTLLPFWDRKADTSKNQQKKRLWISIVAMLVLIALTIWGEVS